MNSIRLSRYFWGILIMVTGMGFLLNSVGILHFTIANLFPLFIIFLGLKLRDKGRRIPGFILLAWGLLLFLDIWFHISPGDIIGVVFSAALIYAGYRFIKGKKQKEFTLEDPLNNQSHSRVDSSGEDDRGDRTRPGFHGYSSRALELKHSLIGELILTGSRWELKDMSIWHGIGDVKIDLSRAFIHDGETVILISGWIGDVDIYVPFDMELSLMAQVRMGDMNIFENRLGGFSRNYVLTTDGYEKAAKRVRIIVNLVFGDIDVTSL